MNAAETLGGLVRVVRDARHGIVYAAPRRRRRREVALTFDDGPSDWTLEILDVLREHDAQATFFVLGSAVAGRESVLRRAHAGGHELANHAFSHRNPDTLTDAELAGEIRDTSRLLEQAGGVRPLHFRPPYAGSDHRVAAVARSCGLRTVLRSVDPADWNEEQAPVIAERVLEGVRAGSIVCLHDALPPHEPVGVPTRAPTVDALRTLLPALEALRLRPVTVTELLR